jgi:hypothetical protein
MIEYTPETTDNVVVDFFLKFASEEEAYNVLNPEVTTITTSYDEEGNPVETISTERQPIEGYSIDTIGIIYKETGVDDEGNPIYTPLDGWHVNLRGADTTYFDTYKVEPKQPVRIFA